MKRIRSIISIIGLLAGAASHAGPMGFEGSWMAMGDLGPNWRDTWVNYALTPRDAIGGGYLYMRSDDKSKDRELAEATYTRLLTRWNMPSAQANIWFVGGLGAIRGNDFSGSRFAYSPGVQADYETTRIHFGGAARLYRARGINHDFVSARGGFSFYEAEYEDTQPWLVLEARYMRDLSDKVEITPMLRLVNKRFFIEGGVSNNRDVRFNFMYIF
jgi:hypothetical protein